MDGTQNTKNATDLQCLPSLCRGLYNRVAQKLGCDPSYVSRVARGERSSKSVSEALRAEIQETWAMANVGYANGDGKLKKAKPQQSTEKALASSRKS
jgi:transcriptional regulator with XRE-family HTH domain